MRSSSVQTTFSAQSRHADVPPRTRTSRLTGSIRAAIEKRDCIFFTRILEFIPETESTYTLCVRFIMFRVRRIKCLSSATSPIQNISFNCVFEAIITAFSLLGHEELSHIELVWGKENNVRTFFICCCWCIQFRTLYAVEPVAREEVRGCLENRPAAPTSAADGKL